MKSVSYYDPSYSPNEACEATETIDCGGCYDTGMIDEQVYCDCEHGTARNDNEQNCYFCETSMVAEINPWREDVCTPCAMSEFGH